MSQVKCAMILSGCGYLDGTETHEAISANVQVSYFAPNVNQYHVIDHNKMCNTNDIRDLMSESARISRCEMKDWKHLKASNFHMLIVPGGFGVGKNLNSLVESSRLTRQSVNDWKDLKAQDFHFLVVPGGYGTSKTISSYTIVGDKYAVNEDMQRIIKEFHNANKPMAFFNISSILPSYHLRKLTVTFGEYGTKISRDMCKKGVSHVPTTRDELCIDVANKIVTASTYLHPMSNPHTVYDVIGRAIKETIKMKPRF